MPNIPAGTITVRRSEQMDQGLGIDRQTGEVKNRQNAACVRTCVVFEYEYI